MSHNGGEQPSIFSTLCISSQMFIMRLRCVSLRAETVAYYLGHLAESRFSF